MPDIDFNAVQTYLPSIATFVFILVLTACVAFSPVGGYGYPFTMLTVLLLAAEPRFPHSIPFTYWFMWIQFGHLWSEAITVTSSIWTWVGGGICAITGLYSCYAEPPPALWYVFFAASCIPSQACLVQYMQEWDVMLHVGVFLFTYYFDYYCTIFLSWGAPRTTSSVMRLSWPLVVSRWVLPLVGIQWMYYAYEISGTLSRRPPATTPPRPPSPSPQPHWVPYRKKHPKRTPTIEQLMSKAEGIHSI
jgi:hypothetical protein